MKNKIKYGVFVIVCILGYDVLKNGFNIIINIAKDNYAIPNLLDFFGNVIISISSAFVAYIVSRWQIKENEIKEALKLQRENQGNIKLLIHELKINKEKLDMAVKDETPVPLGKISSEIWDRFYYKVELNDELFEKLFLCYHDLILLKRASAETFRTENTTTIKDVADDLEFILNKLNESILSECN